MKILLLIGSFLVFRLIEGSLLVFSDSPNWNTCQLEFDFELLAAIGRSRVRFLHSKVKRFYIPTQKKTFLQFVNLLFSPVPQSAINLLEPACKRAFLELNAEISSFPAPDCIQSDTFSLKEEEIVPIIREWHNSFGNIVHLHFGRNDGRIKKTHFKGRVFVRPFVSGPVFVRSNSYSYSISKDELFFCPSSSAANIKIINCRNETNSRISSFYVGPIDHRIDCCCCSNRRIDLGNVEEISEALHFALRKTEIHQPARKSKISNYVFWRGGKIVVAVPFLIMDSFPFQSVQQALEQLFLYFPLDIGRLRTLSECARPSNEEEEEFIDVEVLSESEANYPQASSAKRQKVQNVENALLQDEFVAFIEGEIEEANKK